MHVPPPHQSNPLPPDPPGIHVEADRETAQRFQRRSGVHHGNGYAYRIVEDGEEALRAWKEGQDRQAERSRLLDEATDELAQDAARPVIDERDKRDRTKVQRHR